MTANFKFLVSAGVRGENDIKRLGNSLQGVQGKAKNLGMAVRGVGSAFKALFAAAAVAGFSAFVKGAIDSADAFGKLSTEQALRLTSCRHTPTLASWLMSVRVTLRTVCASLPRRKARQLMALRRTQRLTQSWG